MIAVIAVAAGCISYFLLNDSTSLQEEVPTSISDMQTQQAQNVAEELPKSEIGSGVLSHIVTAGNAVDEAYKSRPTSYELDANAANFATISSCLI
ncbi:MAG: hypothetical protein IJ029_03095, partial [Lachnospiraceae bacterium]|nr:hypothetical protein [Lachnospiraceae bacterium]